MCFEDVYNDMLFIFLYEIKSMCLLLIEKSNTGCSDTIYGCCPDQVTIATGPNNEGCSCKYASRCFILSLNILVFIRNSIRIVTLISLLIFLKSSYELNCDCKL